MMPGLAGAGAGHAPPQPAGQLPVAADPAIAAADVGAVTGRIVLEQLDIAQQPGPHITAFEQIVAEDAVLGETLTQRQFEGVDIVDALADEGAFAEDVLVNI